MANIDKSGVNLAITVLVVGLLVATALPVAIGAFNDDTRQVTTHTEGETVSYGVLNVTADTVDSTNGDVTVTVSDTKEDVSVTYTVAEGQNTTFSMPDGGVDVSVESIDSSTTATLAVEYPPTYGSGAGVSTLYGLIPMFLIVVVLLYVVKVM